MKSNFVSYLKKSIPVSRDEEDLINRLSTQKTFRPGEPITTGTELHRNIYFIEKGLIKLTLSQPSGQQLVLSFIGADRLLGFMCGSQSFLSGMETIAAVTDCEILIISDRALDRLYNAIPPLKEGLRKISMLDIAAMLSARSVYHGLNASLKYKKLLDTEPLAAQMASQTDIASYLEITPASLSRIRKKLVSENKKPT